MVLVFAILVLTPIELCYEMLFFFRFCGCGISMECAWGQVQLHFIYIKNFAGNVHVIFWNVLISK
jgi:hypothetical protein